MTDTPALSEKETRMIRRYCVCPRLAMVALIMAFALAVPFLLGFMIGDLVFYGEGDLRFIGLGIYVALVIILLAVFCYCALAPKFGMRGRHWKALAERLRVRQAEEDRATGAAGAVALGAAGRLLGHSDNGAAQALGGAATVTGAIASVAVTADAMAEIGSNARTMAEAYDVLVPDTKRATASMVAVPLLGMAIAFGAQYVSAAESFRDCQAAAAEQVELLSDAFEDDGLRAHTVGDPIEAYSDDGYAVYGFLSGDRPTDDGRYVRIDLDKTGLVTDVWYSHLIDREKSLEENLAQAKQDFAELGEALSASGARAEVSELLTTHELSEEFCRQFLTGDIYTELWLEEHTDDAEVRSCFSTEERTDFDDDTQPEIWLVIEPD